MAWILAKAGGVELKIKEPTKEEKNTFNPMDNSPLDMRKISKIGYIESFTAREGLEHTVLILKESGLVDSCVFEYSCAMKSHFRKSGNQMSGKWKSSYASLLA